ncbi:hypothetical protein D3C72_965900 [compost metagenome]
MLMHPHRFFTGAHGGKLRLAHGVERALRRWSDGSVNRFPCGVCPLLHKRIIPVTEHRREGNRALTGLCRRCGFGLAVPAEVAVSSEDNLTGRMFLTGKARQRKKVHGRQRHHDGFAGQVMHGKRGRIALRYPQPFSRFFFPFDKVIRPFYRSAFQGAFEAVSINKLNVNQRAGIVLQRHDHITGAVGHAAGFVRGGQRQVFERRKALAGQVGVAGGRAGFLQKLCGKRGCSFAAGISFSLSDSNNVLSNRRQAASQGAHLPGRLGGRHAEHLLDQFQPVTRAALVAEPRPTSLFVVKAKAVRAAAHRAGLMLVFNHLHTQRRENARPVAACLFYSFRYVHFHRYFLPQCTTGAAI